MSSEHSGLVPSQSLSMSSPQIAGMAAVYLTWNPTATPAEVRDHIIRFGRTGIVGDNLANNGAKEGAADIVARSIYNGMYTNVSGVWKTVINPQAKSAGAWTDAKEIFKKVSGVWTKIFG